MSKISNGDITVSGTADRPAQAWVFAGGDYSADQWSGFTLDHGDIVVGVDKGIEHCLLSGLVPDILVGDFDSVSSQMLQDVRLQSSIIKRFPARKNSSDLELALHCLVQHPVDQVTLFGISGGRSDHHLFNWLLPLQQSWPFALSFIDATVHAHLVSADHPLQKSVRSGQTVSLLPMPQASGVCTQGLEYGLHNAELGSGSTLGLSNLAASSTVRVSVSTGQLWVFCVK